MPRSRQRFWLEGGRWLVLLAVLSGCAQWAAREPVPQLPLQQATVERLRALLVEEARAIESLKGLFRAQIQGPGIPGTQHVEGAVFYQRPDALRLQGYNRFGMKLFELAVGEDRYTLRLINGQLLSGFLADLSRSEKVARPFRLSVLAMTGVVGVQPIPTSHRVVLVDEGERYRLDVYASQATSDPHPYRRVWFDRRLLSVVRDDRLNAAGEMEATVEFDDFRPVDLRPGLTREDDPMDKQVRLTPYHIVAQDPLGRSRVQLAFHELSPNVALSAEELQLANQAAGSERSLLR